MKTFAFGFLRVLSFPAFSLLALAFSLLAPNVVRADLDGKLADLDSLLATNSIAPKNEQVLAEVNSAKIYSAQLEAELLRRHGTQLEYFGENEKRQLRTQLLRQLIDRQLLLNAAQRSETAVSEEKIAEVIEGIRRDRSFKTEEDMQKALAAKNLDMEVFRQGLREDLAIEDYLAQFVYRELEPEEGDLRQAYERTKEDLREPKQIKVRHIFFRTPQEANEQETSAVRTKAEAVLERVREEGADFAKLAKKYSDGIAKRRGGELGFVTKNQLPSAFAEVAFRLKVGEISDAVRTEMGFHLIKLEEIRGGEIPTYESVRMDLVSKVLETKKREALSEHLKSLEEQSKVIVYLR